MCWSASRNKYARPLEWTWYVGPTANATSDYGCQDSYMKDNKYKQIMQIIAGTNRENKYHNDHI